MNQEGGSSALVLILAGVIITGIVGSMAYSMTDDVDKQRNTSTDGQQQTEPYIGKAMGQLAYNLKNRSKDDHDDDFNISNMKCSRENHLRAEENEKSDFRDICIGEIQLMSNKINEILYGLKVEGILGYVKYLIERKNKYVSILLDKLESQGAVKEFFEDHGFIKLMEWYKIINLKKDPKEDINRLLDNTLLENIISYDELFKNDRIADYMQNKSGDIIEYKSNSYKPDKPDSSWELVTNLDSINDDDFYMVKVRDKGYLINFAPKKVGEQFPPIDSDVNKPVMDALKDLSGLELEEYYKLKEDDPEDIKLKHLGKILVYMLKNEKGFFNKVSDVFSRENSKNNNVASTSSTEEETEEAAQTEAVDLTISLDYDFERIPEGSKERKQFCRDFQSWLGAKLGVDDGSVQIRSIRAGSVIVECVVNGVTVSGTVEEWVQGKIEIGVEEGGWKVLEVKAKPAAGAEAVVPDSDANPSRKGRRWSKRKRKTKRENKEKKGQSRAQDEKLEQKQVDTESDEEKSDDDDDDKSDKKYEKFVNLLKDTTIDTDELKVYVDKEAERIKNNIKRESLKQTGPLPPRQEPAPAQGQARAEAAAPAADCGEGTRKPDKCKSIPGCKYTADEECLPINYEYVSDRPADAQPSPQLSDVVVDIYSNVNSNYDFDGLVTEARDPQHGGEVGYDFKPTDTIFFIHDNSGLKPKVVSVRCIFEDLEIGNAYTMVEYREKGLSKKLINEIVDYIKDKDELYYVLTKYDHVKKMWEGTDEFFLAPNTSDDKKWKGDFLGLNNQTYTINEPMYVLRNNNCSTLYIFNCTANDEFGGYLKEGINYLDAIPKHNIVEIDFENRKYNHNKYNKSIDKKYDNDNFYKYVNGKFSEITYRFLIIFELTMN